MNKADLTKGTAVYYSGDMANEEGFGSIIMVTEDRWGTHLHILMNDGRTMVLAPHEFSDKYLGHGGTRFVTRAAYDEWKSNLFAKIA